MNSDGNADRGAEIASTSAGGDEWMDLGIPENFAEGSVTRATLPSGFPIAVYRVDGAFYVTSDRCTHGAASLSDEGELDGHVIECAWHYGTFDVRTGEALTLPCRAALPTFSTRIEDDQLLVRTKANKRQQREKA